MQHRFSTPPLKANDTVSSVLYLDNNGTESAITQEFVNNYDYWKKQNADESKTNLPFVTDCDEKSLPLYVNETDTDDDFEWAHDKEDLRILRLQPQAACSVCC